MSISKRSTISKKRKRVDMKAPKFNMYEAVKKHRMFWAMICYETIIDKEKPQKHIVMHKYFPEYGDSITHDCFLCYYVNTSCASMSCGNCPVEWDKKVCYRKEFKRWQDTNNWLVSLYWALRILFARVK